jgi:hypothetical protein
MLHVRKTHTLLFHYTAITVTVLFEYMQRKDNCMASKNTAFTFCTKTLNSWAVWMMSNQCTVFVWYYTILKIQDITNFARKYHWEISTVPTIFIQIPQPFFLTFFCIKNQLCIILEDSILVWRSVTWKCARHSCRLGNTVYICCWWLLVRSLSFKTSLSHSRKELGRTINCYQLPRSV